MKYLLTLLVGAVAGGALVYFLFVGAPRANELPGQLVRPPAPGGPPAGTAVLELDEQFFNEILSTIFNELGQPSFRLSGGERPAGQHTDGNAHAPGALFLKAQGEPTGGCTNQVLVLPDSNGVQTTVRLTNNQVIAPLAFNGTYNAPLIGCQNFRGTAQASINLSFDQQNQMLYGQLNVEGVNLEGMSPLLSGPVTAFVQNVLNQRVNPMTIMRGEQIALAVPVQATGGTLRARATSINSEVKDGRLRLFITYDFNGVKNGANPPPS